MGLLCLCEHGIVFGLISRNINTFNDARISAGATFAQIEFYIQVNNEVLRRIYSIEVHTTRVTYFALFYR